MLRALELITLDLLCLHSNSMPQYLEQTIRNAPPVAPVRSKRGFQLIQQGPSEILDHLDSVLFADVKLEECKEKVIDRHLQQGAELSLC